MFQLRWSWPWHTQVSHNPLFNQEELTTANPSTRGVMEVFVWPGCQDAYCHVGSGYGCGDGNNTNTHRKWKRSDAKSATAISSSGWNWQTQGQMKYDMIWKSCEWNITHNLVSMTRIHLVFPFPATHLIWTMSRQINMLMISIHQHVLPSLVMVFVHFVDPMMLAQSTNIGWLMQRKG